MNSNTHRKHGIRKLIHIWNDKDFNEETQTITYTMCKKGIIGNFVLYINDLLLTNNDKTKITWLIDQLKKRFEMSKLENLCKYFSIEFVCILDGIFVYQCNYGKENLKFFGMQACDSCVVPI